MALYECLSKRADRHGQYTSINSTVLSLNQPWWLWKLSSTDFLSVTRAVVSTWPHIYQFLTRNFGQPRKLWENFKLDGFWSFWACWVQIWCQINAKKICSSTSKVVIIACPQLYITREINSLCLLGTQGCRSCAVHKFANFCCLPQERWMTYFSMVTMIFMFIIFWQLLRLGHSLCFVGGWIWLQGWAGEACHLAPKHIKWESSKSLSRRIVSFGSLDIDLSIFLVLKCLWNSL